MAHADVGSEANRYAGIIACCDAEAGGRDVSISARADGSGVQFPRFLLTRYSCSAIVVHSDKSSFMASGRQRLSSQRVIRHGHT